MSLIVTIIIMLILAGVSIRSLTGDKGLIKEAKQTKSAAEIQGIKEQIELAKVKAELKSNNVTMETVIQQLIKDGVITDENQVNKETGDITFGDSVLEGELADYVVSPGEKYYGDKNIVPTNQKYFSFTVDSKTGTATLTGVKDEYAVKAYQNGEATQYTVVIKDGDTYVKDVVIPYEYVEADGKKYSVTIIGTSAFQGLTGDNVTNVEERFTSFVLPNTITTIKNNSFFNCISLIGVNIPDGVNTIGGSAFSSCSNLTKVVIPKSVSSIGNYAFHGCTNLNTVIVRNGSIGSWAFSGCKNLSTLKLENGVTSLGDTSFFGCDSLNEIDIPQSVTHIGGNAFQYCTNLKNIIVAEENSVYCSLDGILYNKDKTKLIICPEGKSGEVIIPDTVNTIKEGAFSRSKVTSVQIPVSVTRIESRAFELSSLGNIVIPNSITSIENAVFNGIGKLKSVVIPESVTSIGDGAFYNCQGLSSINIPNSVISIGKMAFWNCRSLSSIYIPKSVTTIGATAFSWWNYKQTINCEILESEKPDTWDATWDYFDSSTPRKAILNWGVSM